VDMNHLIQQQWVKKKSKFEKWTNRTISPMRNYCLDAFDGCGIRIRL
jgi:hypothetical protein